MNHLLFTVYDEKAEVFLPPFFVPTIGIATRAFSDAVNSPEHQFGKHPQDYTLFRLGYFDDSNAEMVSDDKKTLGNGVEFVDPNAKHTQGNQNAAPRPSIQPDQTG